MSRSVPTVDVRVTGTGAPLVYVPGIDGTGALFYTQLPRLVDRYRVATYRLRDSATHMDELVDDLARVLDVLSPSGEPATLVSESFGGALAMSFALRHHARVQSLVVLNSFAHFRSPWQLHAAIRSMQLLPWALTHRIQRVSSQRHHSPTTPRADILQAQQYRRASTREGYVNRLRMLSRYDVREQLPSLSVPTLYLAGDRDTLIPSVQQAHFMASRVPDASVRVLEGHGHACLLAPDVDVGQLMQEWRADHRVAARSVG